MLDTLRTANIVRQARWPGAHKADLTFRALEVCGEVGELAEAVKKYLRRREGIAGSQASVRNIADELGDVIVTCDLLARDLDIDLSEAVMRKFNQTSDKYGIDVKIVDSGQVQHAE